MARFHPLLVTDVRHTTRNAVVVTLRADDPDLFAFQPGQYLTFKRTFGDTQLRRSYSICSAPGEALQVAIKSVDGGAFSTWANSELAAGETLDAMPPMGTFSLPDGDRPPGHGLAFAAGSGITPILSILKSTLEQDPHNRFTLVYANQGVNTIMFRDELEDLKNEHLGRLSIVHILSGNAQDIDLFSGRLTRKKCAQLFEHWIDLASVDVTYICGPKALRDTLVQSLQHHGVPESAIRFELFAAAQSGRLPQKIRSPIAHNGAATVPVTLVMDGTEQRFDMRRDQSVLQAALAQNLDVPFACQAGVCSTCRCRVTEGEVDMAANHALEDYEVANGYVLSCQSYPVSDTLVVDYDDQGHVLAG